MSNTQTVDRSVFNYGIGWGTTPKPPVYAQGQALAERLGQKAMKAIAAAWEAEHAVRQVRLAETDQEKAKAVAHLTELVNRDLGLVDSFEELVYGHNI